MRNKTLDRPFELRSVESNGRFTGYASLFGELDSYRDIVMPGAFAKTIQAHEAANRPVPVLWQHRSGDPIGVYEVMREDDKGLYVEGQLTLGVQKADEAHKLLKARALSGISIGYNTVRDEWDDKAMTRKLFEVELWEASLVTFPALQSARVESVKSLADMTTLSEIEGYLRDVGDFSNTEAKTIVSRIKALETQRDVADAQANQVREFIRSLKTS